jgi:hypothetical protein
MNVTDPDRELRTALDGFETSLATPIVSGELEVWSAEVSAIWAKLSPLVQQQLVHLHPKQFDEITKQDPELFAHVDKLRIEDASLEETRSCLDENVSRLAKLAPLVEPDERKFNDLHAKLRKDGVDFANRVKQQQVAVQTWYMEAFNRDRGVAD